MELKKGLKFLLVPVAAAVIMSCAVPAGAVPTVWEHEAEIGESEEYEPAVSDPGELFDPDKPAEASEPVTEDPVEQSGETSDIQPSEVLVEPEPEPVSEPVEESSAYYIGVSEDPEDSEISEVSIYVSQASHFYVYENENDNDESSYAEESEYNYESEGYEEYSDYEYEPEEPERDTSSLDISDYEISDTIVLTPQDWEALKNGDQRETSNFELKASPTNAKAPNAFSKLKEESKGGNDDWVFLVWGIVLLSGGVIAVGAVIATTVISKKKR